MQMLEEEPCQWFKYESSPYRETQSCGNMTRKNDYGVTLCHRHQHKVVSWVQDRVYNGDLALRDREDMLTALLHSIPADKCAEFATPRDDLIRGAVYEEMILLIRKAVRHDSTRELPCRVTEALNELIELRLMEKWSRE